MDSKHTAAAETAAENRAAQDTESPWYKSSHSGSGGGACVEVAAGSRAVRVRDSKDPSGPVLAFSPAEWTAFVRFAARH